MAVIENTILINRSIDDVFDFAADMRNETQWNPDARSIEKITEGAIGAGTRYLAVWKSAPRPIEVTCVEHVRPNRLVFDNGGPIAVRLTVTFTPEGSGTRMVTHFDARPNGWFKLVFPIFVLILRRAERKVGQNIKRYLESQNV